MLPIHYWWKSYSELVRGPNTSVRPKRSDLLYCDFQLDTSKLHSIEALRPAGLGRHGHGRLVLLARRSQERTTDGESGQREKEWAARRSEGDRPFAYHGWPRLLDVAGRHGS